ncbi:MAG: tail fiber domain-containing protein [Saprospiraceae bacterium]|nr:tail fiber domain-containing protein [Saprospiraceae bacterium]
MGLSDYAGLKTDVSPFSDGLNVLMAIKPVWFRYNGEARMPADEKGVGTIAQELQRHCPN